MFKYCLLEKKGNEILNKGGWVIAKETERVRVGSRVGSERVAGEGKEEEEVRSYRWQ